MNIAHIVGYWMEGHFKSLYFYNDSTGDTFAKLSSNIRKNTGFPFHAAAPTIFLDKRVAEQYISAAMEMNAKYKNNQKNVFKLYGYPSIEEIDINPLCFDTMTEDKRIEYTYHKLQE